MYEIETCNDPPAFASRAELLVELMAAEEQVRQAGRATPAAIVATSRIVGAVNLLGIREYNYSGSGIFKTGILPVAEG